ncbi:MAG: hypothetical protein Q8P18_27635 [Pseudomonadota bacterium]|nr:hypothetical protein [Pseudomonadota bacterium]
MRAFLPALVLLAGCESGTATVIEVDVASAIATAHGPDAPGVLVTDAGLAPINVLAPLCGEPLAEPVTFSQDHGFGCLEDAQKGTQEVLRAWVQPAPEGWDFAAFCALVPHAFRGLTLGSEVTGEPAAGDTADTADTADTGGTGLEIPGLATEPDPSWPQGEVEATWKRDFSPCGGILRGDVRIE